MKISYEFKDKEDYHWCLKDNAEAWSHKTCEYNPAIDLTTHADNVYYSGFNAKEYINIKKGD